MLEQAVVRLLEKRGSDLSFTRQVGGSYNAQTGTVTGGTPTTIPFRGVFINYDDRNIDGTLVQTGDRRLLVSATSIGSPPAQGDVVSGHRVVNVRAIAPKGVAIAYTCQVRA